jgi:uncharacterized membrane protein YcfT
MLKERMMWILWPSFLMAGVLEILVFALVDPHDLHWFGMSLEVPRQAVYTLGFFAFWIITAISSALTVLLAMPSTEINATARD